jgi:hypothetical protein
MLEQREKWASHARAGQQGGITGSVVGFDGQAVAGVCVTAVGAGRSVTAAAAPDGSFRLAGLTAGSYKLEYRDCTAAGRSPISSAGYLTAWYGGTSSQSTAARVQVTAGQVRHVPVMKLKPVNAAAAIAAEQASFRRELAANGRSLSTAAAAKTGTIAGKVTGKGKPLSSICVLVAAVSAGQAYAGQTSKNGAYTIRGVLPGQYQVIFEPLGLCSSRANWLQQVYRDDNSPFGGTPTNVRIRAGHKTAGISAKLRQGGEISGTVTSKSGARLRGICVFADANTGHGQYVNYQTQTAANGSYYLHSLFPGKYSLYFEIGCGSRSENYAPVTHPLVPIHLGQERTVNQVLAAGASVSGVATLGSSSGAPLSGICVFASNASGTVTDNTSTNGSGQYQAIGLTGGTFQVQFSPGCNNNGNYTSVTVTAHTTAGQQTNGIDAVLQPGATISGTITGNGDKPLSGICVVVAGGNAESSSANFNANGSYYINQLPAGAYQVGFLPGCGNPGSYAPYWYNNQPSESTATSINLTTGESFPLDVQMKPGATISGKVTGTGGNALSGVCVYATPQSTGELSQGELPASSNRHGSYSLTNLAPGQYVVNFGCGLGPYGEQWFPGAPDAAAADAVSAPAGRTANINATLQPGGTIKGVVTGQHGHPLSGVCAFAVDTKGNASALSESVLILSIGGLPGLTGSRGTYELSGLAAGRYQVSFSPCTGAERYAEQWYRGKASPQGATDVTVRAGRTTSGIDARLVLGGTISGHVTGTGGNSLRNICVFAATQSAGIVGGVETGKAGTYTIFGLGSGRYSVEFSPCGGQNLVTVVAQARVKAPRATTGVNATLQAGGSISGAVTAGSAPSGPAVSGICVEVYSGTSAEPVDTVTTGMDGSYLATGLPVGTYELYFNDPQCLSAPGLAPQWYDGQLTRATAQTVSVTAVGSTTSSIDAALQPDGQITGTVSAGSPASPLSGACVTAVPLSGNTLPAVAVTGKSGYTLAQLVPGLYKVKFSAGCGAVGYVTQWWSQKSSRAKATVINVGFGQDITSVSATLSKS